MSAVETITKSGQNLVLQAGMDASRYMMNLKVSEEGELDKALLDNAMYIGVGLGFMDVIAPMIKKMVKELQDQVELSESEATIMQAIFAGRVFKCIQDALNEHE